MNPKCSNSWQPARGRTVVNRDLRNAWFERDRIFGLPDYDRPEEILGDVLKMKRRP
jgi:hypothetical protein